VIDPCHIAARKREVINHGRGYWSADLDIAGDVDRFYQEYVLPLRELSQEGVVGPLQEESQSLSGNRLGIISIHIRREVDLASSE
jgi:hypothetical protein